ncbi:hypothetical protein VPHD479_0334 [Vibrio phage D479]
MFNGINSLMRMNRKAPVVPPPAPISDLNAYATPPFFKPDPEPTRPKNDVEIFFDQCASFDWYHEFSDDHSKWLEGSRALAQLEATARAREVFREIYIDWRVYMFSGENFGTERAPKPNIKNYTVTVDA